MISKISSKLFKMRFLLFLPIFSYGEDLILDNQTVVLHGAQTFEIISLKNNSAIYVDSTTSKLILYCDSIFIDSTSGIYADNISLSQNSMGANFTDVGAGGAGGLFPPVITGSPSESDSGGVRYSIVGTGEPGGYSAVEAGDR